MKRLVSALGLLLIVSMVSIEPAHAAGLTPGSLPNNPIPGIGHFISHYESYFNTAGQKLAEAAIPYGEVMLRAFLILSIAFYGIMMMIGIRGRGLEPENFFIKMFWWGTVFSIFLHYGWIARHMISIMGELGTGLANAVTPASASGSGITSAAVGGINASLIIMGQAFHMITHSGIHLTLSLNPAHDLGVLWSAIWDGVNLTMGAIVLILVALVVGVTAMLFVAMSFKFLYFLALAIGLGPIFLPTLMFTWTRESFFDGWYQFTWSALMYKLVGPALLGLTETMFLGPMNQQVTTSVVSVDPKTGFEVINWGPVITILILSILGLTFMFQINTIVSKISAGAALPDGLSGNSAKMMIGGLGKNTGK